MRGLYASVLEWRSLGFGMAVRVRPILLKRDYLPLALQGVRIR